MLLQWCTGAIEKVAQSIYKMFTVFSRAQRHPTQLVSRLFSEACRLLVGLEIFLVIFSIFGQLNRREKKNQIPFILFIYPELT